MTEELFEESKHALLSHIQNIFEEMEEDMVVSHQEKFALLEDMFDQATDIDELKVAFEQWYTEHADDLNLETDSDELWLQAMISVEDDEDEEEW
ncbi:MAG: hypothetical protein A3G57_01605 [Candidatus Andersenbacteria bacterium RIFCSPLOWO2_12_FULL_45_8]|nr:MAG: hypothetical protein A3I74_01990 [Candidatus Magasanikbacteria bacterium RIFCSPLOWO2_02_FULL_47_16]OGH79808.1 MAG: hypothetical protein A3C10_05100 [Candidatus Magasanikbacteria bacterium RIFCSPHIGHO2_02_FULL_48_18]OGY39748.1 MAG: hypothetical protein A3G57_01605 [Candidatus Andersenbacteria bacterium RIFCSPLOWO2_12_FULL_45_8]HAZ28322.1 hypothetical protein [Candidatus Magasanikbacteria bacterium]